ncbi:MAG: ABC transporter ATP-binding protein [Trueperaceae bacterium]|nr:ABC transporter ATP-binding protein [Trueperaceae bacterium]
MATATAQTTTEGASAQETSAAITVRDLVKRYGAVEALRGVSFEVGQGEMFALLGPNGAGKTTLFSILATLRKATSGEARVLGFSSSDDKQAVRQQIGIVFQEPALDDRLTALDNLELMGLFYGLSRSDAKRRARETLDTLGISELAKRQPYTFSGGQKRKLELARAIIAEPKVLFLDEATLGLDVDARRSFWNRVRDLAKAGSTVFFTTHYMEEAEVADRIALISEGEIVALDTPRALKSQVGGGLVRLDTDDNEATLDWLASHDYDAEASDEGLFIVTNDPTTVLPTLLKALPTRVTRAEIREPSLEDVFLTLTGKSLSGDVATGQGQGGA